MTPRILGRLLLVILLAAGCMLPVPSQAAGPQRVAIVPFTANAKDDVSFLVKGLRDMLATRLAWREKVTILEQDLVAPALAKIKPPYNEEKARSLGKMLNVEVVVYGSITVLGKAVSVDARVLRVNGQDPPLTAFVQAAEMDQVIPSINDFAQRINAEIFQRPEAVAALAQAEKASQVPPPSQPGKGGDEDNVERLPENISPLNPLFMRNLTGVSSDRYWRSPRISGTVTSIAVADIDGDGKNELLVLMPDSLKVYRLAGNYFAVIHEYKNGPRGTYLFVDAADIDLDGKPEVFVSNINYRTVESFVLTWNNGLQLKQKDLPFFFRVQPNPLGEGQWLLGQRASVDKPYSGPVYRMKYDGKTYEPDEALPTPKYASVFGMLVADLNGGGKLMNVVVGPSNSLIVHASNGQQIWRSGEAYAASDKYITLFPGSQVEDPGWEENQAYLPTRLVLTDLNHDKRPEVVVVRNLDKMGGFLEKTKMFYQGTIFSLDWNGMSLDEVWRTPKISGYVTDYTVADVGNVGRPALVLCVGQRGMGGFLDKGYSHVVAFTLKEQKTTRPVNKGL